jgi:hypothetical protein
MKVISARKKNTQLYSKEHACYIKRNSLLLTIENEHDIGLLLLIFRKDFSIIPMTLKYEIPLNRFNHNRQLSLHITHTVVILHKDRTEKN